MDTEPKKWRLIGGRIPKDKASAEIRRRRPRNGGEQSVGDESIRDNSSLPESSFVHPQKQVNPSEFDHLKSKSFDKGQQVWAIACDYSTRGLRYSVDDLPYTIVEGPIKWKGLKSKWDSYKVESAKITKIFFECNLHSSKIEAEQDAVIRNFAIK